MCQHPHFLETPRWPAGSGFGVSGAGDPDAPDAPDAASQLGSELAARRLATLPPRSRVNCFSLPFVCFCVCFLCLIFRFVVDRDPGCFDPCCLNLLLVSTRLCCERSCSSAFVGYQGPLGTNARPRRQVAQPQVRQGKVAQLYQPGMEPAEAARITGG